MFPVMDKTKELGCNISKKMHEKSERWAKKLEQQRKF